MNPRLQQNVTPYRADGNAVEPRATDRPYVRLAYECHVGVTAGCREIKTAGNLMCWPCHTTLMRSLKHGMDGMVKEVEEKLDVVEAKLLLRAKFGDELRIHDEHLFFDEGLT